MVKGLYPGIWLLMMTAACSFHSGSASSVLQGGLQPPLPPPPATVVPDMERAEAAAPPRHEVRRSAPAPAEMQESAETAPGDLSPAEVPEASLEFATVTVADIAPAAPAAPAVPAAPADDGDEVVPSPELVGPGDEAILEELEREGIVEAPREEEAPAGVEYDIPIELNIKVLDYIEIFQTTRRASFVRGLSRSRAYETVVKEILREEQVPTDLYYLALIESAFNPKAYSRAHASGMWQFIRSTGRMYGLSRTHWMDERRDVEKSTRAAARHLRDLHEELRSWPLALAAYNAGVNRVKRDIRKAGTRDFWKLRLPAQTRNYVPAFYAALILAKEPERYGFVVDYDEPLAFEEVDVDGGTRLSLVATFCGTSLQRIKDMNPELRQACAPPGGKYSLKVPPGTAGELLAGLARTPKPKITGWDSYRIRSGDTLSSIAARFGTSVEAIQEVNNLPGHFIRAGNRLVIPGSGLAGGGVPRAPEAEIALPSSGSYRVRRGDSLWSISRRFGLSLERLMALNGLKGNEVLAIGRVLQLAAGGGSAVASLDTPGGEQPEQSYYRVRKGDNLWRIARKFDTDVSTLRNANRLSPGQVIYPGERLLIPGGGTF